MERWVFRPVWIMGDVGSPGLSAGRGVFGRCSLYSFVVSGFVLWYGVVVCTGGSGRSRGTVGKEYVSCKRGRDGHSS